MGVGQRFVLGCYSAPTVANVPESNELPGGISLRVDRAKIVEYLLNREHPDGRSKAAFFEPFGFRVEEWEILAEALRSHGRTQRVVDVVESSYGTRYIVEGELATPDGRKPFIRTVWTVEASNAPPRLITAYPVQEPR